MNPGDLCTSTIDGMRLFPHDFRDPTVRNDHTLWGTGEYVWNSDLLLVLDTCVEGLNSTLWYRVLSPRGEIGWLCDQFARGV